MSAQDNKAQVQKVLKVAASQGCEIYMQKSGHYKIVTPSGQPVFCAQTPSDWRGVKRTISRLRKAGVNV